jgi:diguanylate cyclase (GGDEF)-like protein
MMPQPKTRWGLVLFFGAPLLAAGILFIALSYPFHSHLRLYIGILPIIGLACSLSSFFIGHFSYPRIHNLKVYLIGYAMGIIGLGYFLLFHFPINLALPPAPQGFVISLYLLISLNILAIQFVPSFVKYRTAKQTVMAVFAVESVVLLICRFSPTALKWTIAFSFQSFFSPTVLLGILFFTIALLLSLWRIKNEFYLGGIFAGLAFCYMFSWLLRTTLPLSYPIEILTFACAPIFLEAGILVHWLARMEHRIAYDPLLHIYNRDYCSKIISEQSNLNLLPPLSVAMVDIDHFKNVNDTYGHQAGDQVLYTIAQAISKEAVPGGVVCRYGGEELIIFFPQKTLSQAKFVTDRLRDVIERTRTKTGKKTLGVTVSIGVSCREEPRQSIVDVIKAADKALYKAKEGGRNQVKTGKTVSVQVTRK